MYPLLRIIKTLQFNQEQRQQNYFQMKSMTINQIIMGKIVCFFLVKTIYRIFLEKLSKNFSKARINISKAGSSSYLSGNESNYSIPASVIKGPSYEIPIGNDEKQAAIEKVTLFS